MQKIVEYIWIDSSKLLRSKARTIYSDLVPEWNFDGSSTGDAIGISSEIVLIPRAKFNDPFRGSPNLLVLCDCHKTITGQCPINSNTRYPAEEIFNKVLKFHPWYGFEQEYVLLDNNTSRPLGWSSDSNIFPEAQGKYYCGVGIDRVHGRHIIEEHYKKCLNAGIKISGINAEVMLGQWEYQVGPCEGINAGDELWMSRYILHRICEKYNVKVSFDPKPIEGDWNGSGLHTNFSTIQMRNDGGIKFIHNAIAKLSKKHKEHLVVYGDNSKRLTGTHETSSPDVFSYGVANRTASIRIPIFINKAGKGYFEDRRPASNADPYLVSAKLAETILL